jgi:hypothetical protein
MGFDVSNFGWRGCSAFQFFGEAACQRFSFLTAPLFNASRFGRSRFSTFQFFDGAATQRRFRRPAGGSGEKRRDRGCFLASGVLVSPA